MAKRIFSVATFTPTAQADGAGVPIAGTYACMGGGAATDILSMSDIVQAGQAVSSAFNAMCLARASTNSITPTALALPNSDGFARGTSTAYGTAPVNFIAAATPPVRQGAVTIARLQLGFNAFGGTLRTAFSPGSEWISLGLSGTTGAVNQSETIFSCMNYGTAGAQSLSVTYEMA